MVCSRKHVFEDLRPYVCIWSTCMALGQDFQKRKDWISHMAGEHWRQRDCPLGCSMTLNDSRSLEAHLKDVHAEDLDTQRASEILIRSTDIDMAKVRKECPLCCNFEIKSVRQYAKHIGHHLEQLALFTLPNTNEYEEEGYEDEDSEINEDDKGKQVNLDHLNKMSESEGPNLDSGDETPADVKMHTNDMSSESHSSIQERLDEETLPENSMSQVGDHSELGAQHFTSDTKLEAPVNTSEDDAVMDFSNSNEDQEESMQPQNAEVRQPHEPDKGQPSSVEPPITRDQSSKSAKVMTERRPPRTPYDRSSATARTVSSEGGQGTMYVHEKKWSCAWCDRGPMSWIYDTSCLECGRRRDEYSRVY